MPAIPIIGLGVSAYSAYKQGRAADKAAASQERIAQMQSDLAKEMQSMGRRTMASGEPALSKAMDYYMRVATGNRGVLSAAIAPERNQAEETYRGAEQGINAKLAPGPDRDRAIAELYRSKAGNLSLMPFQAKQAGIDKMRDLGLERFKTGSNIFTGSNTPMDSATRGFGSAGENRANAWSAYGSLAANATKAATGVWDWYKNRSINGGVDLNTTPYGPGY